MNDCKYIGESGGSSQHDGEGDQLGTDIDIDEKFLEHEEITNGGEYFQTNSLFSLFFSFIFLCFLKIIFSIQFYV